MLSVIHWLKICSTYRLNNSFALINSFIASFASFISPQIPVGLKSGVPRFTYIILIELSVGYPVVDATRIPLHLFVILERAMPLDVWRDYAICLLWLFIRRYGDTNRCALFLSRDAETCTSIRVRQLPPRNTRDRHIRRYFYTRRGLRPRCNRQGGLSGIAVERYGRSYWQFRVY